jgi:hypothetical protein
MVSKDGVLLGIVWMVFTLLFAVLTVMMISPSPSLNILRSLVGPKLVFFSVIIALSAVEYRISSTQIRGQSGLLCYTFILIITFALLFSLLFSVSIDLVHLYSMRINEYAYSLSSAFFALSIYFIVTLFVVFLYTALIA